MTITFSRRGIAALDLVRAEYVAVAAGSLALTAMPTPCFAQLQGTAIEEGSRGLNVGVNDRPRPQYDSPGFYSGGFLISPQVTVRGGYESNPLQRDTGASGDAFTLITGQVSINSSWAQHALGMQLTGGLLRHSEQTARNENRFGSSLRGRYDFDPSTALALLAQYDRRYETQYDLTDGISGAAAVPLDSGTVTASLTHKAGQVRFSLLGNYGHLNYLPYRTLAGGIGNQNGRDRKSWAGAGQVDYGAADSTYVYAQVGYEQIRYDSPLPNGIANRDSNAVRFIAGLSSDLTGLLRGRIGLGYMARDYVSPLYRRVRGLTVEGKLEFFASELTTFTLTGYRRIEDNAFQSQGGYFKTGATLRADHELLRNVLLNASIDYSSANFGNGIGKARLFQAGTGARYLLNQHISFEGSVKYSRRSQDSTVFGNRFENVAAVASIRYAF